MYEHDAVREICLTFGIKPNSKDEETVRTCLVDEIKSIEQYNKSWKQRNNYSDNVESAMRRMIEWFEESRNGEHDHGIKDIVDFIMTRRKACVFSILYAKIQSGCELVLINPETI